MKRVRSKFKKGTCLGEIKTRPKSGIQGYMVWVLKKFKLKQILSLSELVLLSSNWTRSFIKSRLSLRGFPQSILPSHLTEVNDNTIFLAFLSSPAMQIKSETEYEVFMKLFSVLRIASKELIQQTFSLDLIYGRKHFCHHASSRKLQRLLLCISNSLK